MTKYASSARIRLISVFLVSAIFTSQSSFASEELNEIGKSAIEKNVAMIACADQKLIDLAGLNYDACLAKSESAMPYCWNGMEPLLPDLRFGKNDYEEKENQDRVRSTLFILGKCLQASILLSGDENDGTQQNEFGDSNGAVDSPRVIRENGPKSDETWARLIENARSEYVEKPDLVGRISDALDTDDLYLVTPDGRGGVFAFKMGQDGTLTRVSDNLRYWSEILADEDVNSARKTDAGVTLSVGSGSITDLHRLDVSYVTAHEPSLPQCTPELRHILCGSCEVDRTDDHRVILTWLSREIDFGESREGFGGDIGSSSDPQSIATQCWKDGMSQLGIDADPF